jgi:hypothetical protein
VPAFELQADHHLLPREPAAIQAVIDLIRTGRCSLPAVAPGQVRAEVEAPPWADESLVLESTSGAEGPIARRVRMARGDLSAQDLEWLLSTKR